jgi:hypothetical protein
LTTDRFDDLFRLFSRDLKRSTRRSINAISAALKATLLLEYIELVLRALREGDEALTCGLRLSSGVIHSTLKQLSALREHLNGSSHLACSDLETSTLLLL